MDPLAVSGNGSFLGNQPIRIVPVIAWEADTGSDQVCVNIVQAPPAFNEPVYLFQRTSGHKDGVGHYGIHEEIDGRTGPFSFCEIQSLSVTLLKRISVTLCE
ncbi:MAG: hypothetical protein ACOYON_05095 [Fimbriimonas sp.]